MEGPPGVRAELEEGSGGLARTCKITSRDKLIDDALESAGEHRAERGRRDDACPHCGGELTFLREIAPARIPRGPPRLKLAIPG